MLHRLLSEGPTSREMTVKSSQLRSRNHSGTRYHLWDVLATWRAKSSAEVSGRAIDCGHLLPEERPEEVLDELRTFFK